MNKLFILIAFGLFTSCTNSNYRKIQVVDFEGNSISGVAPVPQQIWGIGSRLSDEKGFMYVPKGIFSLKKKGYKKLRVYDDSKMVYSLETENRSESEIIKEESEESKKFLDEMLVHP